MQSTKNKLNIKKEVKKGIVKILSISPTIKEFSVNLSSYIKKKKYLNNYYNKEPIDSNLIIFESYMGRQYSCNPKALYKAMIESEEYKNFTKVWAFKNINDYKNIIKDKNTILIKYRSDEYYKMYSKAKYWVSNSRIPNDIKKHPDQIYIQCWHGTPLKKLGFDIKNYSGTKTSTKRLHKNYRIDAERYNYIISPSQFFTEKITSAFSLKEINQDEIFIQKGYPRNDFLYKFNQEDINRIKNYFNVPKDKKIILYAPTWRENQHEPGLGYVYNLGIDFKKLKKELESEYIILFRAHYFISNTFDFKKYNGFIVNASNYDDINDLYIISDMLITDYSSVFFDYANLNKPIIFYMYDYENYKYKMRDFYLSIDELPGPVVESEKNLLMEIKYLTSNFNYDEKYKNFNKRFNPYREVCSKNVLSEFIK